MKKTKHRIDYDMPIGTLKRIPDFLSPPGELGIRNELNDPKLLRIIAEGRCAIRKGARGILLSTSLKKSNGISRKSTHQKT